MTNDAVEWLCELLRTGAGRAAGSLAQLAGTPIRTRAIRASRDPSPALPAGARAEPPAAGVFVDLVGDLGGAAALLLPEAGRERLLARLLSAPTARAPEPLIASALCEVGNILLSGLIASIADMLHVRALPSPPTFEPDAEASIAALERARADALAGVRVDAELADAAGAIRVLLVWLPDWRSLAPLVSKAHPAPF